ncbi:hypothetical protein ACHAXA_005646 [Cyclostephanos tholiformis]|uniref:Methyltransferase domain-containing protein n=1 Tax=Cyclostephanos tholiformis TaxID=382380 RepID=A0ABD3RBV5_9STRA
MVAAISLLSALAFLSNHHNMPPLMTTSKTTNYDDDDEFVIDPHERTHRVVIRHAHHSSDYGAKGSDHPTSYDDDPPFKGPLSLSSRLPLVDSSSSSSSSSYDLNRVRIRRHYLERSSHPPHHIIIPSFSPPDDDDGLSSSTSSSQTTKTIATVGPPPPPKLGPSTPTDTILKTIVYHLANRDAPVDAKEVAESVEFYLRCGKRLIGAARRAMLASKRDENDDRHRGGRIIDVQDLCSGHGLTGLIFIACNPPGRWDDDDDVAIVTTLVDIVEPRSHSILRDMISEVCPWVGNAGAVTYVESSLGDFVASSSSSRVDDGDRVIAGGRGGREGRRRRPRRPRLQNNVLRRGPTTIVISTHACGSLTDEVLKYASLINAASIAVMPCCYTGTAEGAPYGVRRMLGVGMAADIRRSFALQNTGDYHVDFTAIPRAITPMNRIIVAERRR